MLTLSFDHQSEDLPFVETSYPILSDIDGPLLAPLVFSKTLADISSCIKEEPLDKGSFNSVIFLDL